MAIKKKKIANSKTKKKKTKQVKVSRKKIKTKKKLLQKRLRPINILKHLQKKIRLKIKKIER